MSLYNFELDPTHEFKSELLKIQNPFYLRIAVEALRKTPDYFWFVPASSSGKYHPKSSLGMGGLVRHVKSVFWISEELLQHPLYAPFTDEEKDTIRVAILLHDACKQGVTNEPSHTLTDHPLLVRKALFPGDRSDGNVAPELVNRTKAVWNEICNLIETHMGIWTKDKETGKDVLDQPKTQMQLFVHMCDYLASRKNIEVDVTDRAEQNNYGNKNDEPATEKQIEYIKKLFVMAGQRSLYHDPVDLTNEQGKIVLSKKKAGETIESLKKLMGMA